LSWVFYERKDYANALQYINDARAIRETIGDQRGIGNCFNVVGLIQLDQQSFANALDNFAKALEVWKAIGHEEGVAAILFNQSLVFVQQGDFAKAYDYQLKAIEVERKVLNEKNLGTSYNFLGNLLIKMNRLDEAAAYLEKARLLAKQTGSLIQIRTNHLFWANYYEARGDYKNALREQVRFNAINDSLYRESGALKIAEMEALYQVEQKEQEIKLLNQQAQLQAQEMKLQESSLRWQRGITLGALLALVLISLFAISTYRYNRQIEKANREILEQKEEIQAQAEELTEGNQLLTRLNREVTEKNEEIQAQSEELMEAHDTILRINQSLEERIEKRTNDLKQAYKELDTFFYRSSHDFRRPLTTFLGLAEVAKITVKDHNALELFEKVRETASNLDKMLVKLQSISDVGSQHLVYKEVFPEQLLEDIRQNFEAELVRKLIDLKYEVNLQRPFHSYPALIRIVLENLIENAVFFCGTTEPSIRVEITEAHDNEVKIEVRDNGQGIAPDLQSRVFDMYFRGNERSKGNGLGLYIVKKAVEKLNGHIEMESTLYAGTTFKVYLPNQPMA
jgi:signal transduction histidine kinase